MTRGKADSASDQGGFDGDDKPPHPLRNWHQPLLTAIGMALAVALVAIVDPTPGPLVLAGVLAMTISRNRLITSWRGRAEAVILLPFVGLATAGVGYLFIRQPIIGAVAYVAAMFLSIWLRRFGPLWSRIGSLIALPFVTLLIAPGAGVGTTPLGVALLSIVVLALVVALRLLAEVTRFVPKAVGHPAAGAPAAPAARPTTPTTRSTPTSRSTPEPTPEPSSASRNTPAEKPARRPGIRPVPSTRMAIQMAIALAAAFVIGALVFPQHVTWVVLTAFIVCSGNRGRADVLYKSGLRILGATVGTLVASLGLAVVPAGHSALQGPPLVVVLLVIITVGLWLREWTYAAWAVVMTLIITLLQGAAVHVGATAGVAEGATLWIRILAIIVGAACGLAASWFVLPVRSEAVVRRRLADALAALSGFAAAPDAITDHDLTFALERLDEVGAPWVALERVTRWRATQRKPGQWIDLAVECARIVRVRIGWSGPRPGSTPPAAPPAAPVDEPVDESLADPLGDQRSDQHHEPHDEPHDEPVDQPRFKPLSAPQRRAIGEARRAMRDPVAIGPALLALRDELTTD